MVLKINRFRNSIQKSFFFELIRSPIWLHYWHFYQNYATKTFPKMLINRCFERGSFSMFWFQGLQKTCLEALHDVYTVHMHLRSIHNAFTVSLFFPEYPFRYIPGICTTNHVTKELRVDVWDQRSNKSQEKCWFIPFLRNYTILTKEGRISTAS